MLPPIEAEFEHAYLAESFEKSLSESRSEKVSNEGSPPKVGTSSESNDVVNCDAGGVMLVIPPNMNLCSSSSPAHSVGRGGKSTAKAFVLLLGDLTSRFRGSQKSKSASEVADRGIGEGDGESEGQELVERRSVA